MREKVPNITKKQLLPYIRKAWRGIEPNLTVRKKDSDAATTTKTTMRNCAGGSVTLTKSLKYSLTNICYA